MTSRVYIGGNQLNHAFALNLNNNITNQMQHTHIYPYPNAPLVPTKLYGIAKQTKLKKMKKIGF